MKKFNDANKMFDLFFGNKSPLLNNNNYNKNNKNNEYNNLIDEWNDTKNYFTQHPQKIPLSIKYNIDTINLNELDKYPNYQIDVEVVNEDSFNLAIQYRNNGLNPMVLNMASDYKAGGGVASGKTAQEEELFRRSNAHLTHPKNWYPLKSNEVIYSPQVTIIKESRDKKYKLMDKIVNVSMIACPALRNPKLIGINKNTYTDNDYNIMYKKIESLFKIALLNKNDSLVLGALGCGAYHNPPNVVSNIFSEMIDKYGKYFKKIGFAVLIVKNADKENFINFETLMDKNNKNNNNDNNDNNYNDNDDATKNENIVITV